MCENSCLESDGNFHKGYHSREGLVRTSIDSPHWHLRDLPQHWWHNCDWISWGVRLFYKNECCLSTGKEIIKSDGHGLWRNQQKLFREACKTCCSNNVCVGKTVSCLNQRANGRRSKFYETVRSFDNDRSFFQSPVIMHIVFMIGKFWRLIN